MQLGKVIGYATSTVKHESLEGWRLVVIQPLNNARAPEADPVIAVDKFGSAVGQIVFINADGKAARDYVKHDKSPVRWFVIGILDDREANS